jgi:hypothetical protein
VRPLPTATPPPTPSSLPTVEAAAAAQSCPPTEEPQESETEHIARINQDLLDYGQRVASRNQSEGSSTADYNQVFRESVYVLAEIGVFGCGDGGPDIYSGPPSPDNALRLTYQVMEDPVLAAPGAQLSPSGIYGQVLQRLLATDMSAFSPQDQIAISNGALLTVEPSMPRINVQAFLAFLDRAGQDYLSALAHGETTGSYPQYLNDNGYANVFD